MGRGGREEIPVGIGRACFGGWRRRWFPVRIRAAE